MYTSPTLMWTITARQRTQQYGHKSKGNSWQKYGDYVITTEKKKKKTIVSALGAIPKRESNDVLLIYDCSWPDSTSLNSHANCKYYSYKTVDKVNKPKTRSIYGENWSEKWVPPRSPSSIKLHSDGFEIEI